MIFPFDSLAAGNREVGLVVAVALGFGFGFVLERAGFGRAPKLAAQFYLHDMTVFKVMFSAILTAMAGLVLLTGVGLGDLTAISQSAASYTFLWPMLFGGLLLGAGFITAGYCPGTSIVSTASGNLDGLVTFIGVIVGSVVFGEVFPSISEFFVSGAKGHMFLYDVLGIPAAVLAVIIILVAIALFIGAEKVERIFAAKRGLAPEPEATVRAPRRLAFATFGGLGVLALVALALPTAPKAEAAPVAEIESISQPDLARRVLDEPWSVRVLDLRSQAACAERRIPGAECVPAESLGDLGLPFAPAARDLVLVAEGGLSEVPADAAQYHGRVLVLDGGFAGWKKFALTAPEAPSATATLDEREDHAFRAGLYGAMTGVKQAPPPSAPTVKFAPKKKKGGGCN